MATKLPFLSDDHHFALANVAVRSGQMEYHIEHTTSVALLHLPKSAEYLLKNLGADRVVGLLGALLLDRYPDDAAKIKELVSEIERTRGERNEVLHWIWGKTLKEDTALHVSVRPFRPLRQKTKTAPEIQKIANDMMRVIGALIWWNEQIHAQFLRSLRDKP